MARVRVIKDDSVWRAMKKRLRANDSAIKIGWFEGQAYGPENGNLPMAQVAQWVEEGQRWQKQPARPAIRTYFVPLVAESGEMCKAAIPLVHQVAMGNMSWKKLHEKLAPSLLYKFQLAIKTFSSPSNKPSTIAKKGFDDPWIETGTLVQSARFKVEKPDRVTYKTRYTPRMGP